MPLPLAGLLLLAVLRVLPLALWLGLRQLCMLLLSLLLLPLRVLLFWLLTRLCIQLELL